MANKILKMAMVTTIWPETHYSRYLLKELQKNPDLEIKVYIRKDEKVEGIEIKKAKRVFSNFLYPFQICWRAFCDRLKLIHLQHEMNMYGGSLSSLLFPLLVLLLRINGKKVTVTFHSLVPQSADVHFLETFSLPKSKILLWFVKKIFYFQYYFIGRLANTIIVHSFFMKKQLMNEYQRKGEKIFVAPIGIPPSNPVIDKYQIKAKWAEKIKNKKIILFFGYLLKRKGLDYLIDGFSQIEHEFSDYVLVLAGGELDYQKDYAESLRQKTKKLKLENKIIFTSFLTDEEIEKLYSLCEFVVLPYTHSISSSLPLSFAWQYGKPVIGTNIGTLAEEIEDKKEGILVKPENSEQLAEAMRKLIRDRTLYQYLRHNLLKKQKARSWAVIAQKNSAAYREALR